MSLSRSPVLPSTLSSRRFSCPPLLACFIRADSALYNLILQSRKAVKATDFTSRRDAHAHVPHTSCTRTHDFTHDSLPVPNERTSPVATSLAMLNNSGKLFAPILRGCTYRACREYKASGNWSLAPGDVRSTAFDRTF